MKKILIVSANPIDTNKLRLDEEVREIQIALERSRSRDEFQIITRGAVRIDDLRRTLLDNEPQVVHFSGHGKGADGIAVENNSGYAQLVSTESLRNLFGLFKEQVECVLLNACYSESQAEVIYQNIDCVIGMEHDITDKAAINFSIAFYDALGAGRSYQDAFDFGRNNIDLNGIPEFLTPKIKIRNNSKSLFSKKEQTRMSGGRIINMGNGNYNERIQGNYIQGNYNAGGEKQSLAEAAAEIQKLLEQLDKSYPANTTFGKMQIATETIKHIEDNSTLAQRILSALQTGSVKAFEQFLSHPAASFVIGALEDWQKNKSS
ncbi:hypothetical protein NUACC21_65640 [Scytonema sp. NUACC21]